jgi:lipopolysaccharide/colanic/teichoic acid biosynthesis glycosyltransferase
VPATDDGGVRRLARPLLYAGLLAIVAGLAQVHARLVADPPYDVTGTFRFGWTVAYVLLLGVAVYGAGLPDLPRTNRQALTGAVGAAGAAAVAISLVQLLTGDALLPRFVVFGTALLAVPWATACAAVARGGRARAELRDRVLVVGDAADVAALAEDLAAHPERPAAIVDQLTGAEALPSGPRSRPLVERAVAARANVVAIDRAALGDEAVVHQAASLHEHGIRIRTLSLFYEQWLGKLPVSELERVSLLFDIREVHGGPYVRVKRLVDVAFGAAGCLLLAVAVPFVLAGNLVANRGPLLYRQQRVGKNSRIFTILKFRSMRDGPSAASEWTAVGDPRVTRFGRLLRATHLDELPQVVNILRGDLSIVGPRPEQPAYVEELRQKLPFYDLRHLVRPGLTGWAQVKYGYAGDERDALEKLQYEFWYLRHQSLRLDLRIVARTLRSVLGADAGRGR